MTSNYTINGVVIKRPTSFKIERYKITKSERLSNGNMVMDLIAKKRKFILEYKIINASDLNNILNIIWESNDMFFTFGYVESNATKSAIVYTGAIPSDLFRSDPTDWVWESVTVSFIER